MSPELNLTLHVCLAKINKFIQYFDFDFCRPLSNLLHLLLYLKFMLKKHVGDLPLFHLSYFLHVLFDDFVLLLCRDIDIEYPQLLIWVF